MVEDPVHRRWKQKHPKFPGVAPCVELLRRRNVQGELVEFLCAELRVHAAGHATELVASCRAERDGRVRRILFGVLCEARLPEALPVFVEHLRSDDESLRYWSEQGLRALDTPDARKALWQAGLSGKK